jgi:predicted unusual protein kinase regulating ubiquinone biosynthesis (AarF/ABC1/UbiB family)
MIGSDMGFIPKIFLEFAPYLPVKALGVIPLSALLPEAVLLARRATYDPIDRRKLEPLLPGSVEVVEALPSLMNPHAMKAGQKKEVGQALLELYFKQILKGERFYLDLRLQHFCWDTQLERLLWRPTGLWKSLSPDFQLGLKNLYGGFYGGDERQLEKGFSLFGLSKKSEGLEEVKKAIIQHFGQAQQKSVRFEIAVFRESFQNLFEKLAQARARVHPDFAFLGLALASLYMSLEGLDESYDVSKAFERASAP